MLIHCIGKTVIARGNGSEDMSRKTRRNEKDSRRVRISELPGLPDAKLVQLAGRGIPEAFQVLVDRYEALVRSVASKIVGDDIMALEDACQETFLRALSKLGDLRDPSRFKSWLCAIARNQALDIARLRKISVSSESIGEDGEAVSWEIADSGVNPSELHDLTEVISVMQDILEEIPDMYRYPITLRYEEDLEYRDIAKLMGKPLGTVKSLIHRGKSLILKELTRRAWGTEGAHVLAS